MAIELMDEHEQSELVRTWLRNNLNAILVGILAGVVLIAGWYYWKGMRVARDAEAQQQYGAYITAIDAKNADGVTKIGAAIRKDHGDTPYAVFAALRAAEQALLANDPNTAATELAWAREHAELGSVKDVATLRLARVRLSQGESQVALDLATEVKSKGYTALAAELRGDANFALNRIDAARAAYDEALTALDASAPNRAFVQMKRDDVDSGASVATTAPAATTPAATTPAVPAPPAAPTTAPVAPATPAPADATPAAATPAEPDTQG